MKTLNVNGTSKRKATNKKILKFGCLPVIIIIVILSIIGNLTTTEVENPINKVKTTEEIVKEQFNSWDGSNIALEKYIKTHMNDADSYEHVETRYSINKDSTLYVVTKFRGKNAFGAKVLQTVRARIDFKGNVLDILE